jgi:hypothetical protein
MSSQNLVIVAKALEGVGLVVILVGVAISMGLGFEEEGLASMRAEFQGLAAGGALFLVGWLLERIARRR